MKLNLSNRDWALMAVGVAILGACCLYIYVNTDNGDDTPEVETEAQFGGLDIGAMLRLGTNLSLDPKYHFYHPGYDPDPTAQAQITLPHRYPTVTGQNISTLIHRGLSPLNHGTQSAWFSQPPSEMESL